MRNSLRLNIAFITFLIKNPKIFLLALLLGGLVYSYEFFVARDTMSYMGVPKATDSTIKHATRIFRNEAYMVGYSDIKGNPLWVVYQLKPTPKGAHSLKRPDSFSTDWRNLGLVTPQDYTNSGYDRGHLAPNHAMALLYGKQAQEETFLMTNITPQKPSLNQKLWQQLEVIELEQFAPKFNVLWVYTGPLFATNPSYLKSAFHIEIPEAFYKIYLGIEENGSIKALAFIIPQKAKMRDALEKYIVSIDEVERRSGFDFFYQLDDTIEDALEKEIDAKNWF